ncbi:MAG: pirin family protein [Maricaulaceae bacterium]
MIEHRPFDSLGRFPNDWLTAPSHFSFSHYHDPARMGWGALRVWNDDLIQPQTGFPAHPHQNMEIITYVRAGAITHRDSLGNEGRTEAGDVQVMSAGSGIRHAEYNLETEATRLYQIWIEPDQLGGDPAWAAAQFPKSDRAGDLVILASGRAGDTDALPIRADARLGAATLKPGQKVSYALDADRRVYLALAQGRATVNGVALGPRDGLAAKDLDALDITGVEDAELVLVDAARAPKGSRA